jgi:hypothetical protein
MVVAPVDERDTYGSVGQGARSIESAETAANNHHPGKICGQGCPQKCRF